MKIKLSNKTFFLLLHAAIVLGISYLIVSCFTLDIKLFSVADKDDNAPSDKYLYMKSKNEQAKLDTTITLVSIDACKDRFEIARLIEQIDSLHPKAIGLDVYFKYRKEPDVDIVLENVLRKCKNLVLACILDGEQRGNTDTYSTCNHCFFAEQDNHHFTEGFINLDGDGFSTIRTFTPKLFLQKGNTLDTLYGFPAQIVRLYDATAFQYMLKRSGNQELIRFQPFRFYELEKDEIEDNKEQITGKIVLMGTLSEDMHKTPIHPQMYGMEIHAHIISTILDKKFIDRVDNIWTKLMNILLCYLFALFCCFVKTRLKKGIAILIKLVNMVILLIAFFACYYLFKHYNIYVVYTQSIFVMTVVIFVVEIYLIGITFGSEYLLKRKNNKSK